MGWQEKKRQPAGGRAGPARVFRHPTGPLAPASGSVVLIHRLKRTIGGEGQEGQGRLGQTVSRHMDRKDGEAIAAIRTTNRLYECCFKTPSWDPDPPPNTPV